MGRLDTGVGGGGNYWSRIYAWLGMELCLALLITCGWQDICSDVQEEEGTLEVKLPESDLARERVLGTAPHSTLW